MMRGRRTIAITMLTGALVASGQTAIAEGSWSSSVTRVRTGFETRSWNDRNTDSAATQWRLERCTDYLTGGRATNSHWKLMRERGGVLPDENRGEKYFPCATASQQSWGDVPASNYHLTLTKIAGQTTGTGALNANPVRAWY